MIGTKTPIFTVYRYFLRGHKLKRVKGHLYWFVPNHLSVYMPFCILVGSIDIDAFVLKYSKV